MEPAVPSKKPLLIIGVILLLIVLLIIASVLAKNQGGIVQNQPQPTAIPRVTPDITSMLAFQPQQGSRYTALGDINFLPAKVNGIIINREKIIGEAQRLNPGVNEVDLVRQINDSLFSFLAINSIAAKNNQPVSSLYMGKVIDSYSRLLSELKSQQVPYEKNVFSLDGFFLRVQFANVREENIAKLGRQEGELQALARTLIEKYLNVAQGLRDKAAIVDSINQDEQVLLLNNGGKSGTFTAYRLDKPLIGDPDFYDIVSGLEQGKFSNILTLKLSVPGKNTPQNALYAVFYVNRKSGTNLPLPVARDRYISGATIE